MRCELWNGALVEWYWQGEKNLFNLLLSTVNLTWVVAGSSAASFRRLAIWVTARSDYNLNQVSSRPVVSKWVKIFLLTFRFLDYIKSNPSFDCFFVFRRSRFAFWAWRPDLPSFFCLISVHIHLSHRPCSTAIHDKWFHHILHIIISTALLMALDLNICLRL
jgi:hypothetical protein